MSGTPEPIVHPPRRAGKPPSGLVTFVFTDIEGSTRLARRLGAGYREVLCAHRRLLRATLCRDGAELLTEGDSFFVAFADATVAVGACLDAQRALAGHPWPQPSARPRVRMGLHTGHAVAVDGEYASLEVHRAARVAAAAHGDQVLCSRATADVARLGDGVRLLPRGRHLLRGFDDPTTLYQVVAAGLPTDFPTPRTLAPRAHNLPVPLTRFVGRAAERVELRVMVRRHRLVTVCGTGGVGKTRLAVRVARDVADRYPDGVWYADLAAACPRAPEGADEVTALLADAVGVRPGPGQPPLDALLERLVGADCLLLLDTCERHRPAVADVAARLLTGCPGVSVLATGRTPLNVPGELAWRLGPLGVADAPAPVGPHGVPAPGAASLAGAARRYPGGVPRAVPEAGVPPGVAGDALELLSDRVGGRLDAEFAAGAGRLVRQLAGLPLALELAAPLLRSVPPAVLADRLGGSTDELRAPLPAVSGAAVSVGGPVPARHRSMRANVDWSYQLLSPTAARLLCWLSAWPGRIDPAGVQWLTAGWSAADACYVALAELVDAGLLEAELGERTAGYRMLAPLRVEARRLAAAAGELTAAEARCRHRAAAPAAAPWPAPVDRLPLAVGY